MCDTNLNSQLSGSKPLLESEKPKFIDLFAGCGGLSLGLMQAGFQGLFAIEKDQNAFSTLEHNLLSPDNEFSFEWPEWLPKEPHCIDQVLKQYRVKLEETQGKVDLVVGGPPCQGFSSAGKRNPADPRNQLVKLYFRFIDTVQPDVVLIENVRGMSNDFRDSSVPSGKTNYADWIVRRLSDDYFVHYELIDVSEFGVPQKRIRLFIVAMRRDRFDNIANPLDALKAHRETFIRRKGLVGSQTSSEAAISDLEIGRNGLRDSLDTKGFKEIVYSGPRTTYQRLMRKGSSIGVSDVRLARHRPHIEQRFAQILARCHAEGRLNVSLSAEFKASLGLKKSAIRVLDPDSPAPTITSMPDDLIHYSEPRTLTVRENARLQSFPDWFQFQGKYTSGGMRRRNEVPRFTQVANAVPPLIAEAMGEAILFLLRNKLTPLPMARANPQDRRETEAA